MRVLCTSINSSEFVYIENEGSFSSPSKLDWTEWESSSEEYERPSAWGIDASYDQIRKGIDKSLFFTFTVYEARDSTDVWPVIGPGWGCEVRLYVPIVIGVLGLLLIIYTRMKKVKERDQ